jgi:hypothetical protein
MDSRCCPTLIVSEPQKLINLSIGAIPDRWFPVRLCLLKIDQHLICLQVLEPGAKGRFLGLLVAIVPAAFSMGGIELVAMCLPSTAVEQRITETNHSVPPRRQLIPAKM